MLSQGKPTFEFHPKTSSIMFSLNGAVRYRYIPGYKDMRGGYDKLCGVVRSLGGDPEDGTAYVFTSRDRKLVKIIRKEDAQLQLYIQRFEGKMSFIRLDFEKGPCHGI